MRRGVFVLLAVLLVPTALCAPLFIGLSGSKKVSDVVVVELDLEQPVVEAAGPGALFGGGQTLTTRDLVAGLEAAAKDPKVKALYARVGASGHGLATAMEIRDAIIAFRRSGKRAVAFSESFGELSPGTGGYFLATAFDEVWLQPAGSVSLTPLAAEGMFAKGAFEKLRVDPILSARKEFKNAPNTYTETGFTPPHREATLALLTSAQGAMVAQMAAARPALGDAAAVTALLEGGPWTATDALERKLVDQLGYRDQALAAVKGAAGDGATLLWLNRYLERTGSPYDKAGPTVAVVSAVGQIHRGASNADPLSGTRTAGSDTVAAALRHAVDDDNVKAIILRIDSPGGSVVASETIAHEVVRARAAGKPVVASMANVAGSGGYYIAMDADVIVAQPGTITGSIGVYAGKMVTARAWEQVGINFETVAVGDVDTSFFSTDEPYSDAARARLDRMVDDIYTSFVTKVAAGRKKTFDEIEPVAHGRIWSGADAQTRFLVDELGGWPTTIAATRRLLQLTDDAPIRLKDFPGQKPPLAELLAMLNPATGDSSDDDARAMLPQRQVRLDVQRLAALLRPDAVVQLLGPDLEVLP